MSERASVFQNVQIGKENSAGTRQAAVTKLASVSIEPSPKFEINKFRPLGTKVNTLHAIGKEWSAAEVKSEAISYNELPFLLASLCKFINAPSLSDSAYTYDFNINSSGEDSVAAYSIEQGDTTNHAHGTVYNVVTGLTVSGSRDKVELSGNMIGRKLTDGITITSAPATDVQRITLAATSGNFTVSYTSTGASPTTNTTANLAFNVSAAAMQTALEGLAGIGAGNVTVGRSGAGSAGDPYLYTCTFAGTHASVVENLMVVTNVDLSAGYTLSIAHITFGAASISTPTLKPILADDVSIYLDTSSAALGTTKLLRALNWEWSFTGKIGPLWTVDQAQESWAAIVEQSGELMAKIKVEADNQALTTLGLFDRARDSATRWLRIEAVGDLIGTTSRYRLRIDMPVQVAGVENFENLDGVYAIGFDFDGVHDQTWGKSFNFQVVCAQAHTRVA